MEIIVIGDSATSNSLGRAISMAITARSATPRVRLLAFNDGPLWPGAHQFSTPATLFGVSQIDQIASEVRAAGMRGGCVVWMSKCSRPLDRIALKIRGSEGVALIADFDDNDVAVMRSFRALNSLNRLKMNRLRRKHPASLAVSQRLVAEAADGLTFSSQALAASYRQMLEVAEKPTAMIPHAREPHTRRRRSTPRSSGLNLGFIGTVRAHKGAEHLVALMREDRDLRIISFKQEWTPPADCRDQWVTYAPSTPLEEIYDEIDYLVLPMSATDQASLDQLPAKLVDAASFGCPVAATRTPPIDEYAHNAYLPIHNWNNSKLVLDTLLAGDRALLSEAIGDVFDQYFSAEATATSLLNLVDSIIVGAER